MVAEKMMAATESWGAMAAYTIAMQRAMLRGMLPHRTWRGLASIVAPYHRRATANHHRLAAAALRRRR